MQPLNDFSALWKCCNPDLTFEDNRNKSRFNHISKFFESIFPAQDDFNKIPEVTELAPEHHPGCEKHWVFRHFSTNFVKCQFEGIGLPYTEGLPHLIIAFRINQLEVVHLVFQFTSFRTFQVDAFKYKAGRYISTQLMLNLHPYKNWFENIEQAYSVYNTKRFLRDKMVTLVKSLLLPYQSSSLVQESQVIQSQVARPVLGLLSSTMTYASSFIWAPKPAIETVAVTKDKKPENEIILKMEQSSINLILEYADLA